MAPPRVVVVDSGVDPGHPALRGKVAVVAGPSFDHDGVAVEADGGRDELGHGSAVAATIAAFVDELEIVSLRVFGREAVCDFAAVLHALRHALTLEPRVVNLSLGTTSLRYRTALGELAAAARGVRIVAPASYGGLPCDPGCLPGFEGVVADANVPPMVPELRRHGERLVWFASPLPPRDADGGRRLLARGDSLAVAAVSGLLARSAAR
ncbi:MAG: S8 family serine peptidase [Planctomycetes bacterium]|nr:S8 family serine peptidase [Planctomycetota bacterium]